MKVSIAKIHTFFSLNQADRLVLLQAMLFLPVLQACVRCLPLTAIIKVFKLQQVALLPHESTADETTAPIDPHIRRIQWALYVLMHSLPFLAGKCFSQALFARSILKKNQISTILFLGAKNYATPNAIQKMQAHAWLSAGPIVVTGWQEKDRFIPVAAFL